MTVYAFDNMTGIGERIATIVDTIVVPEPDVSVIYADDLAALEKLLLDGFGGGFPELALHCAIYFETIRVKHDL